MLVRKLRVGKDSRTSCCFLLEYQGKRIRVENCHLASSPWFYDVIQDYHGSITLVKGLYHYKTVRLRYLPSRKLWELQGLQEEDLKYVERV